MTKAQLVSIHGQLRDSTQRKNCPLASVAILTTDSSMVGFTRSNKDGGFTLLSALSPGTYYLLITHPGFSPLYQLFQVRDSTPIDLGVLDLPAKTDSLQAVVVTSPSLRPKLRGDTVEFNTANVHMQTNAVVEDLLQRLPGLRINPDGSIVFNGEKIQRLLVDGEDIFGGDPTIISKNFDADKIEKVQLLNRRSDQSRFTGVDDGQRQKTLNLVLKASVRKSYFGKAEAGSDLHNLYEANGLVGSFRGKEQITALGLTANTGVTSFNDNTGGSNAGLVVFGVANDALGASAGTGIPQVVASGLHYANSWNGMEDHLVGNYQYGHLFTQPLTTMTTVQTLPDSVYTQSQRSQSVNQQAQHWGFMTYDLVPDSLSAFQLNIGEINSTGENQFGSTATSLFNDTLVNESDRSVQSKVAHQQFNASLSWRHRFPKKAGRSLSLHTDIGRANDADRGSLYSLIRYYQPGGSLENTDSTDQHKQISDGKFNLAPSITYTEPLFRKLILSVSYKLNWTRDDASQATYNRGEDGEYQEYVDSLSSHYKSRITNHQVVVDLGHKTAKLSYTAGIGVLRYLYNQRDVVADSTFRYTNTSYTPHLFFDYTVDPSTFFSFYYIGTTQQPSAAQLQPAKNNSDPLHLVMGNPALHPGFTQAFILSFTKIQKWIKSFSLNYTLANSTISTLTSTDSLGRQVSQPINVSGGFTGNLTTFFSRHISSWGIDLGLNATLNYKQSFNYINTDLNRNTVLAPGGGIRLAKFLADQFSIEANANFSYFDSRNSVNTAAPIHYWTQNHTGALNFFALKNYQFGTTATYTWQQKTSQFTDNTSTLLWNAYALRNFLQNRLVLRAQVLNLLDRNAGIARTNTGNVNTESSTNIRGRYWLLSVIYRFSGEWKGK